MLSLVSDGWVCNLAGVECPASVEAPQQGDQTPSQRHPGWRRATPRVVWSCARIGSNLTNTKARQSFPWWYWPQSGLFSVWKCPLYLSSNEAQRKIQLTHGERQLPPSARNTHSPSQALGGHISLKPRWQSWAKQRAKQRQFQSLRPQEDRKSVV